MRMSRNKRLAVFAATAALAGGVLTGGVIAAQSQWLADPEELSSAVQGDPLVKVADIGAAGGAPAHGVFVQRTSTGHVCLWDAPSASSQQRQGGCNSIDDPLGGSALSASLAYEGGPAVEDVLDARLIGLASREVASVHVVMSDGTQRQVRLKRAMVGPSEFRAFGYRFKKSDLRGGIGPTAVIARSTTGDEIARQSTGIGR